MKIEIELKVNGKPVDVKKPIDEIPTESIPEGGIPCVAPYEDDGVGSWRYFGNGVYYHEWMTNYGPTWDVVLM